MLILANVIDRVFSIPNIIFLVGGVIAIVGIVCWMVTAICASRAKERTQREIAAYVAEGTIDADKGVEMMKAAAQGDAEA